MTGYAVFGQDYTGAVSGAGVGLVARRPVVRRRPRLHRQHRQLRRGAWLVTATDYDTEVTSSAQLDASATAAASRATPGLSAAQVDALSTRPSTTPKSKTPAGVVVLRGQLAGHRHVRPAPRGRPRGRHARSRRARTPHTVYDQGAPTG